MNEKQQLWEDARKFAAQFAGFLKAAELMGQVGSIEQAEQEAAQRVEAARAAHAQFLVDAAVEADAITTANANARAEMIAERAKSLREAQVDADKARQDAQAVMETARAQASAMISDANAKAANLERDTKASLSGAMDDLVKARAELETITAQIAERSAALADINSHLAAAREKLR